jgi:hypothetical protein
MPGKRKLTVRVDQEWIEAAKEYAHDHNTSLSRLISEFLKTIPKERDRPDRGADSEAPVRHSPCRCVEGGTFGAPRRETWGIG